ncbi:hypothetical protein PM082_010150 [Marasmius tenuissimus]|nr:hypothetical protein PM082_010150 [Marasmius tenuissimus]
MVRRSKSGVDFSARKVLDLHLQTVALGGPIHLASALRRCPPFYHPIRHPYRHELGVFSRCTQAQHYYREWWLQSRSRRPVQLFNDDRLSGGEGAYSFRRVFLCQAWCDMQAEGHWVYRVSSKMERQRKRGAGRGTTSS